MRFPEEPAVLTTARLRLRPFEMTDASAVQRLAGDRRVAETTLRLPHPYPEGAAEAWIATHPASWAANLGAVFALTSLESGELLGTIGLTLDRTAESGELGYWLGVPFWGKGYATEAARAVVGWGFSVLELRRIEACHFAANPASGAVLRKAGLRHEGVGCRDVERLGAVHTTERYGLAHESWQRKSPAFRVSGRESAL